MAKKIELSEHFDNKKLIQFSYPLIISMMVSSIFGSVDDGLFVSNFVGKDAFAAINLVIPGIMILGSLGLLFGSGGSALLSKLLGEGKKQEAKNIMNQLIEMVFLVGLVLGTIGFIFMRPIATLLGADETLIEYSVIYGRIQMIFLPLSMLWYSFQSLLVVAEKPKLVFHITLLVSITNTLLDVLLIWLLKLGIYGATIATVSGMAIGGILPFLFFVSKNDTIFHFQFTKIQFEPMKLAISNGVSDLANNVSISLVNILYNLQLINLIGNDGVVAYSIIMYISFIFIGVYVGYSMSVSPIIGYNYGSKNVNELKNVFKRSIIMLEISSIVLTLIAMITARPMSAIFVSYDATVWDLAVYALRAYGLSYLVMHLNIFISSLFVGLNNGKLASFISIPRTFILQIIMIFLLPSLFGANAIWYATFIAEILTLFISIPALIKNHHKYNYY